MKQWRLSQASFDSLLALLDQDQGRAAKRYNELYQALCGFAVWKGSHTPEEQVDETLDRVCCKLEAGEQIEDVFKYTRAVLRLVLLEGFKQPQPKELDEAEWNRFKAPEPGRDDPRQVCLDRCLNELPDKERRLIVAYYEGEMRNKIENRKRLAVTLGITKRNLEVRASRIRLEMLFPCIEKCLQRQ